MRKRKLCQQCEVRGATDRLQIDQLVLYACSSCYTSLLITKTATINPQLRNSTTTLHL